MTLSIKAWDTAELLYRAELSPWRVDIPHEEVQFDTGRAEIRKDQQAKLDASYDQLAEVAGKYAKIAAVRLFIAGHTDSWATRAPTATCRARGPGPSPPTPQEGRAHPHPLRGLRRGGAPGPHRDETPEEKNRCAEYIVAIDDPVLKNPPFPPQWRKL